MKGLLQYEEKFADSLNDIHSVIRQNDLLTMNLEVKDSEIISLHKQISLLKQGNSLTNSKKKKR